MTTADAAESSLETPARVVAPLTGANKRDVLCLFLSSLLLIAFFTHVLPGTNDGSRYSLAMALATTGTAEIGPIYNSLLGDSAIDKARVGDKYYCDKAPLGAFVAAPAVWVSSRITFFYWGFGSFFCHCFLNRLLINTSNLK